MKEETPEGTDPSNEITRKEWLRVVLEEFKASRVDDLEAGKHAQTTIQISILGLSILFGATVNIWDKDLIPGLILFLFIPVFAYLFAMIWIGEIARRMRVSKFVLEVLEPKVNRLFPNFGAALAWEKYLREPSKNLLIKWNYIAIICFYLSIPIASVALGNVRIWESSSLCTLILINLAELGVLGGILLFLLKIGKTFK